MRGIEKKRKGDSKVRQAEKRSERREKVENDNRKRDRSTGRTEYVNRMGDREEEQSVAEKAMEKVDILQNMVVKMEGKIKKLESMVESMLRTHNDQMNKIITLITLKSKTTEKRKVRK